MKALATVPPTPEQLTVIEDGAAGFWLIRGAAGSGKTTTALLRLKFLVRLWRERRMDLGLNEPVRVLVLTFNRTLRGYVEELARQQIVLGSDISLEVETFGRWAINRVNRPVIADDVREHHLRLLAAGSFPWSQRFLGDEVNYVLGRFLPGQLADYLTARRDGRGRAPAVDRSLRQRLLDSVIVPYGIWKAEQRLYDWNDLAVTLAQQRLGLPYDVVIVDEAQDFSANQLRAVVNHLAPDHVTTFIRDSAQRIYPNSYRWTDIGISFPAAQNKRLRKNYRNTKQIAAFARPLLEGVEVTEDSEYPDFTGCVRDGLLPAVIRGRYRAQLDWVISYLRSGQVGAGETVAFLHPLGWFRDLEPRLDREGIPWVTITQRSDWPDGPEQVVLSTMHSAKGLEFDHVIIIGYNAQVVPHGGDANDALLEQHRRLLAMSVGRARRTVVVGYKPEDASALIGYLEPETFEDVQL